jgi:site-specific DNA-methyltransferase (adenine-specific)
MGDNDLALRALANLRPSSVTLAYMDPPFLTQRVHEKRTFVRRRNAATLHASDEPSHIAAFDDRWRDRATYLESLAVRLTQIKRVLTDDGSVVVHVDPKTSHYVKVLCDEIFGEDAFASEIIWRYRRWPARTPNFQRVHDVLLRYRKDPKAAPCYNQLFEPLAASTVATWGTKKQRAVVGEDGVRARSSRTDAESAGVPMGDVWEIGVIAPVARERTGYPSQKPEALLERLVRALSRPGDTVLDPYAGSGTTLAVAARLGRSFVGMDASPVAEATIVPRLDALGLVRVPAAPPESQTRCAQKLGMAARELPRASLASAKAPRTVTAITPNAAQALYPRRKRA